MEIVSQCTTGFGRKAINSSSPTKLLGWIKDRSVTKAEAENMSVEDLMGKFVLGDFVDKQAPVFAGSSFMPPEEEE